MNSFTFKDLLDFLSAWNQEDKADSEGYVPINPYNVQALLCGMGFTLKWFVTKKQFYELLESKDIEPFIFYQDSTRLILTFFDSDRVEIEVENFGVLDKEKESFEEMHKIFESLELEKGEIDLSTDDGAERLKDIINRVAKKLKKNK